MEINIALNKTITQEEYSERVKTRVNLVEENVWQIIFEDLMKNTLPLKITILEEQNANTNTAQESTSTNN